MRTSFTLAALVALPLIAGAQEPRQTGNGFLFHKPDMTIGFRMGYSVANASSDVFAVQRKFLTIGSRGFDALSVGGDLGFNVSRHVDLGLTVDGTYRSTGSEYRGWLDADNRPITQSTQLTTIGFSANVKYNLVDRGRAISTFAWIPARWVPYVGVGGGILNYGFRQRGDFISFPDSTINTDELQSNGWTAMAQLMSGFTYAVSPRLSLLTEARYTYALANLHQDYADLGRINLSGLALNVGFSIRN